MGRPDPRPNSKIGNPESVCMINKWLKIIHKTLYPPHCLVCGGRGQDELDLCGPCAATLPYNRCCCRLCAVRLPDQAGADLCGKCALNRPDYDSACAMFEYQEPIRYLIRSLKFNSNYASGRLLGSLMAEHLRSVDFRPPELIVPVPLHRNRFRQRGFNQSIELARPIANTFGIPLALNVCIRQRDTAPQVGLVSAQRRKNIKHAFATTRPLVEKHVAIFDDVITTGCTIGEMAKLLRQSGAEIIDVWSIARASLTG